MAPSEEEVLDLSIRAAQAVLLKLEGTALLASTEIEELISMCAAVAGIADLSNRDRLRIQRHMNRIFRDAANLRDSLSDFHKDGASMMVEKDMPVPLAGGGSKPPDDDEIDPEGGG